MIGDILYSIVVLQVNYNDSNMVFNALITCNNVVIDLVLIFIGEYQLILNIKNEQQQAEILNDDKITVKMISKA